MVGTKPYESKTKVMDFRVGGRRFYAMVSPEGNEMWHLQQYTSITPKPTSNISVYLQIRMKTPSTRV